MKLSILFFQTFDKILTLDGGIKGRFPVRLPSGYDINLQSGHVQDAVRPIKACIGTENGTAVPSWLRRTLLPDNAGPTYLAEMYEVKDVFFGQ